MIDKDYTVNPTEVIGRKYELKSADDLAWLSREMQIQALLNINDGFAGCQFTQTQNFDLNSNNWLPIGNEQYPFKGSFDGKGYSIANLTNGNKTYVTDVLGLFGCVKNAELKNISITGSSFRGTKYSGLLAGIAEMGLIENCYVQGGITGEYAGMVGYASGTTFRVCGSVLKSNSINSAGLYSGGIVGFVADNDQNLPVTIINCYASGEIKGRIVGGLVGFAQQCGVRISTSAFDGEIYLGQNPYDNGEVEKAGYILADAIDNTKVKISDCIAIAKRNTDPSKEPAVHMVGSEGVEISNSLMKREEKIYQYEGDYAN